MSKVGVNSKKRWSLSLFEQLSLFFSIVGFSLVIYSLHSTTEAVNTSTYLQTYGWTLEADKSVIDNPQVRRYFRNGDRLLPRDSNSDKVNAIAEYMLDNFDAILNNKSYFNDDPCAKEEWQKTVADNFKNSPSLCSTFTSHRYWYDTALRFVYDNKDSIRLNKPCIK